MKEYGPTALIGLVVHLNVFIYATVGQGQCALSIESGREEEEEGGIICRPY